MCVPIPTIKSCENEAGITRTYSGGINTPWMDAQHPIFDSVSPIIG